MADSSSDPVEMPGPSQTTAKPSRKRKSARRTSQMFRGRSLARVVIGVALVFIVMHFGSPYYYLWRAQQLLTSDPHAAASLLEQHVLLGAESFPKAEVLWSHALLLDGKWAEAMGAFSQIKTPETVEADSLLNLAKDAFERNIDRLAKMALDAIGSEANARPQAVELLMSIAEREGNAGAVLDLAKELDAMGSGAASINLRKARAYEQLMDLPAAAAALEAAIESAPDPEVQEQILRTLVRINLQLGRPRDARGYQTSLAAITANTPHFSDQLNEAKLQRLEGDIDGSSKTVNKLAVREPHNVEVLELRATLLMDRLAYQEAVADLERVLSTQPWNKQAHYKIAQALNKSGRTEEATGHLEENRRLLALSNRIVSLRMKHSLTSQETVELIRAMEESGMKASAAKLREVSVER